MFVSRHWTRGRTSRRSIHVGDNRAVLLWPDILRLLAVFGVTGVAIGAAVAYMLRQYFEHRLSIALERQKVTFTRLHEMRAEALANVYAAVVRSEQDLRDWVYTNMPVGIAPVQIAPEVVLSRIRRLRLTAARTKILLPARSYEAVDRVVQRLEEVSRTLERRDLPVGGNEDGQWEAHTRAIDGLDRDVASAKTELEQAFAAVLQGDV